MAIVNLRPFLSLYSINKLTIPSFFKLCVVISKYKNKISNPAKISDDTKLFYHVCGLNFTHFTWPAV